MKNWTAGQGNGDGDGDQAHRQGRQESGIRGLMTKKEEKAKNIYES